MVSVLDNITPVVPIKIHALLVMYTGESQLVQPPACGFRMDIGAVSGIYPLSKLTDCQIWLAFYVSMLTHKRPGCQLKGFIVNKAGWRAMGVDYALRTAPPRCPHLSHFLAMPRTCRVSQQSSSLPVYGQSPGRTVYTQMRSVLHG